MHATSGRGGRRLGGAVERRRGAPAGRDRHVGAIVAPLAAGDVPVWVAASFDGDIVLIPVDQLGEASELLCRAGHRVVG